MEFNWLVGHLFGGLRNKFVLNVHSLKIWVVQQLVYSAPSLQVEHCIGFAGEHLTEWYIYIYIYSLKESEDGQLLTTKKLKNLIKNKNVSVLDLHQLHEKLNLSNLP